MSAALVIGLVAAAVDLAVTPIGFIGLAVAFLAFIAACAAIGLMSRPRKVALAQVRLEELPAQTEHWLEQQRASLPSATGALLDSISVRLSDMAPRLSALDPEELGADAVRRLLAVDLPALVRGYQEVPPSLRSKAGASGVSADAHIVRGLTVIDGEIERMTEQLGRGAFDELATQNRFLELKYESGGGL